jgi:hypothetical protein
MSKFSVITATVLAGCVGSLGGGGTGGGGGGGSGSGSGSGSADPYQMILDSRTINYSAALRNAALRLTGQLPTLAETSQVTTPTDPAAQATAYNALIADYLTRPTFAQQAIEFWRNTFKQGGTALLDTAPVFAAELSATNGSYMDLFTAGSGNCPTYSGSAFVPGECGNGGPVSGVLTNPGVMSQFFSNFGFRRVRWVQEIFDCTAFPAEVSSTPQNVGGASPYTGVWPFGSIAGGSGAGSAGRINFQDVSSVICANCHTTINHIAPLLAYYDLNGMYQTTISVPTPLTGAPPAVMTDYLPPGEATAWRYQVAAPDIPTLGKDMAADPAIAECGVARVWNWALGKQDIVDALELVPPATIQAQVSAFTTNGFKLRDMLYTVFTSDDFVKF